MGSIFIAFQCAYLLALCTKKMDNYTCLCIHIKNSPVSKKNVEKFINVEITEQYMRNRTEE